MLCETALAAQRRSTRGPRSAPRKMPLAGRTKVRRDLRSEGPYLKLKFLGEFNVINFLSTPSMQRPIHFPSGGGANMPPNLVLSSMRAL